MYIQQWSHDLANLKVAGPNIVSQAAVPMFAHLNVYINLVYLNINAWI